MQAPAFLKPNGAGLAPMAGATDSAFRRLCMELGADYCVSEMISAKALTLGDKKTHQLMRFEPSERPFGIQLFGAEPETMARAAAEIASDFSPDFLDINMGCPTPKITSGGAGSALMREPARAAAVARAVVDAVSLPVTAKIRAGFKQKNAPDVAKALEQAGVTAITVHGRTMPQMYKPPVDYGVIADVVGAVALPVVGNGDIFSAADASRMRERTGCYSVLVGRGALGNPFLFEQLKDPGAEPPSIERRMDMLRRHVLALCALKGDYIGMREARKHATWYTKGFRGAAKLRAAASGLCEPADIDEFIALVLDASETGGRQ